MPGGPFPAGGDGGLEQFVQAISGDHELQAEILVARGDRPLAGEESIQTAEDLPEIFLIVGRGDRVVERLQLVPGELPEPS